MVQFINKTKVVYLLWRVELIGWATSTVSFTEVLLQQVTKCCRFKTNDSKVTLPNILENLAGKDLIYGADLSAGTEQSFTGSGSSNQSNSYWLDLCSYGQVFGNGNLEILGQS